MTTEAQNVGDEFSALCHGLASGSYPDTYRAYKQLYQIGRPVVPYITEYLNEMEFSDLKRPVEFRFLNDLLSLLNDIDETKANEVGDAFLSMAHNPAVEQRVRTISSFTLDDCSQFGVGPLKIFEAKGLNSNSLVEKTLSDWISYVLPTDLENITRLYVVPRRDESFSGTYMPILFNIVIVWSEYFDRDSPLRPLIEIKVPTSSRHKLVVPLTVELVWYKFEVVHLCL